MILDRNRGKKICIKSLVFLAVILFAAAGFQFAVLAKTKKKSAKKTQFKTVSGVQIKTISGTYVMEPGSGKKLSAVVRFSGKGKKPSVKVKWKTGNKKILSVTQKGFVKALAEGETTVYASCSGKKSKKIHIIVGNPVSKIQLQGPEILMAGCSVDLQPVLTPADCAVSSLKWKTSDSSIATVSSSGRVKGKAEGTVTITAVSQDGHETQGSITLNVKYFRKQDIRFVAHRGLSAAAPENTLAAFSLAGQAGFWGAECDIWETAPQDPADPETARFAICHNPNVSAIYGVSLDIRNATPSQLSSLTAKGGNGISMFPYEKLPFLEDFLVVCRRYGMHPVIEIKTKKIPVASAKRLVETVRRFIPLKDAMFISFHHVNLDRVKKAAAEYGEETTTVYLFNESKSAAAPESLASVIDAIDRAAANEYSYVSVPFADLTSKVQDHAAEKRVGLYGTTTDSYERLRLLIFEYRIPFVFTNKQLFQ